MRGRKLKQVAVAIAVDWDRYRRWRTLIGFVALVFHCLPASAQTQENCNTALTRIARRAADKAVVDHHADACAGLKNGPFGIDKTKALELRAFSLCETGPVVTASITVRLQCATSDQAMIHADLEDDLTATASANLDTCQVLDTDVTAGKFASQAGIAIADLKQKLRQAAEKQIKDYCK